MANPVISWAQENPLYAGAAALGVVVVAMLLFGGSGEEEGSQAANSNVQSVQAYYGAVSNQAAAGAAIQMEQIKANASTNQALIAATYGIERDQIWAPVAQAGAVTAAEIQKDAQAKNYDLAVQTLGQQERIAANLVNLENARLGSNERITQLTVNGQVQLAKAQKPSGLASILSSVASIGKTIAGVVAAPATGGASLLPALGSSGKWV